MSTFWQTYTCMTYFLSITREVYSSSFTYKLSLGLRILLSQTYSLKVYRCDHLVVLCEEDIRELPV